VGLISPDYTKRKEKRASGSGARQLSGLFPKRRFDAELIHRLNENAYVMRQHFTKGFVDLRCAGLASQAVAKLGLDHVEGSFDV